MAQATSSKNITLKLSEKEAKALHDFIVANKYADAKIKELTEIEDALYGHI